VSKGKVICEKRVNLLVEMSNLFERNAFYVVILEVDPSCRADQSGASHVNDSYFTSIVPLQPKAKH
jgi:hypothetical protein